MALYLDPTTHPEAYDTVIFARTLKTPGKCKVEGFNRENEYDIKTGKGTKGATETLKGQPPAKGKITFWTWTAAQRQAWTPILEALKFDPSKTGNGNTGAATPAAAGTATSDNGASTFQRGDNNGDGGSATGTIPEPGNTTGKAKEEDASDKGKSDSQPALTKAAAIEIFYPTLADIGVNFVLPPEKLGIWEPEGDDFSYMKRTIEFVEFTQPPNASIAATPTGADDKPANGAAGTPAGAQEPSAASGSASANADAGKGAQGAWGAP